MNNICYKKCPQYKTLRVYFSQGSTREPKITLTCLANGGSENLITFIPRAFLNKGEHLILVLLHEV